MKKIVNGNSGCKGCINYNYNKGLCTPFVDKQVANGLENCFDVVKLNYIYEKETKMKLTKAEKKILKSDIEWFIECGGFIHTFEGGITRVYIPVIKSNNCRMYWYGQSVCNPVDKYNKKRGIHEAFIDLNTSDKTIPLELIKVEFRSELALEYIG